MFHYSKKPIHNIKLGNFSNPKDTHLQNLSLLKSKAHKPVSITSEDTRDEDFTVEKSSQEISKMVDFNKKFSKGITKKRSVKNSIDTKKSRQVKRRVYEISVSQIAGDFFNF
jgi:hypothetical protein